MAVSEALGGIRYVRIALRDNDGDIYSRYFSGSHKQRQRRGRIVDQNHFRSADFEIVDKRLCRAAAAADEHGFNAGQIGRRRRRNPPNDRYR